MRTINKIIINLLKFYQERISLYKKSSCRFYPSCSNYAIISFKKYKFLKALSLSLYRIIRCNPWNNGGVDEP